MIRKPYIGVIGERTTDSKLYEHAVEVGMLCAEQGWILICGGMGGVMEGAAKGVAAGGGIALGILPGCDRAEQNPYLTYSVVTGLFEARNSLVVRSSNVIIAIGGSYGTLSEIAFAKVYGVPVVGLESWELPEDRKLFAATVKAPEEAISAVKALLEKTL